MAEFTPGGVARAAMYGDPQEMAEAIRVWHAADDERCANTARWLRQLADALAPSNGRSGGAA